MVTEMNDDGNQVVADLARSLASSPFPTLSGAAVSGGGAAGDAVAVADSRGERRGAAGECGTGAGECGT